MSEAERNTNTALFVLKEIPKSEAMVAEATDYVLHFCGLDCYSKWKVGEEKSKQAGGSAGSK